jgi:hypothetical protein
VQRKKRKLPLSGIKRVEEFLTQSGNLVCNAQSDCMRWWQFSLAPFIKILAFASRWQFLRKMTILLPLMAVPYFLCMPGLIFRFQH